MHHCNFSKTSVNRKGNPFTDLRITNIVVLSNFCRNALRVKFRLFQLYM